MEFLKSCEYAFGVLEVQRILRIIASAAVEKLVLLYFAAFAVAQGSNQKQNTIKQTQHKFLNKNNPRPPPRNPGSRDSDGGSGSSAPAIAPPYLLQVGSALNNTSTQRYMLGPLSSESTSPIAKKLSRKYT